MSQSACIEPEGPQGPQGAQAPVEQEIEAPEFDWGCLIGGESGSGGDVCCSDVDIPDTLYVSIHRDEDGALMGFATLHRYGAWWQGPGFSDPLVSYYTVCDDACDSYEDTMPYGFRLDCYNYTGLSGWFLSVHDNCGASEAAVEVSCDPFELVGSMGPSGVYPHESCCDYTWCVTDDPNADPCVEDTSCTACRTTWITEESAPTVICVTIETTGDCSCFDGTYELEWDEEQGRFITVPTLDHDISECMFDDAAMCLSLACDPVHHRWCFSVVLDPALAPDDLSCESHFLLTCGVDGPYNTGGCAESWTCDPFHAEFSGLQFVDNSSFDAICTGLLNVTVDEGPCTSGSGSGSGSGDDCIDTGCCELCVPSVLYVDCADACPDFAEFSPIEITWNEGASAWQTPPAAPLPFVLSCVIDEDLEWNWVLGWVCTLPKYATTVIPVSCDPLCLVFTGRLSADLVCCPNDVPIRVSTTPDFDDCPLEITTDCCPDDPLPLQLYAQITDACPDLTSLDPVTLNYMADGPNGAGWYSDILETTVGMDDVEVTLQLLCTDEEWIFTITVDEDSKILNPTNIECSPFCLYLPWEGASSLTGCVGDGFITVGEEPDASCPPEDVGSGSGSGDESGSGSGGGGPGDLACCSGTALDSSYRINVYPNPSGDCPCSADTSVVVVWDDLLQGWYGTGPFGSCGHTIEFLMYCDSGFFMLDVDFLDSCDPGAVHHVLQSSVTCAPFVVSFGMIMVPSTCGCGVFGAALFFEAVEL